MNTSDSRAVMALAEIADRQARLLRTLSRVQLVQAVIMLMLGLSQIANTVAIRGMK